MSTRILRASVVLSLAFSAVGCSSTFVTKTRYDEDIQQLKNYSDALERRNRDLEGENAGLKSFAESASVISKENEFYEQIARQIESWLKGSANLEIGDVTYDAKTGKWTMAGDVLFDSGSYALSRKGREILKTFSTGYSDKNIRFRIVGHTDRDPIVRDITRKALPVSHTMNMELSALRAVAVAEELQKNGITEGRFIVEGHGNNSPIAPNDKKAENKKKNRRVEIYVVGGTPTK